MQKWRLSVLIELAPLEQFLEESGEPHLIIDRVGRIAFATEVAKSLLGVTPTLSQYDADASLADLLAGWFAQRQCFGYTGMATLRAASGTATDMCLMGSTVEYRGTRHLLCHLRPIEHGRPAEAHLWGAIADAARESAFAAAGAMVEHELNQSLAAIVNYVQTSAVLLRDGTGDVQFVRDALSEAGQQALHCAELLRVLRRSFGYQNRSLETHSLTDVVRQAHALLAQSGNGRSALLELQSGEADQYVRLSHAHFLSMLVLLMQRCLRRSTTASKASIKVRIASEGRDGVVVRFLNCGAWDLNGTAPGRVPTELYPSDNADVRLLAICQVTMSLHGGYVSIAEDPGRNAEIRLSLKKTKSGGNQHA